MAEEENQNRRISDRYQAQLDTRALEIAASAMEATKQMERRVDGQFTLVRDDLREMRTVRDAQHQSAEAKFQSITRAQWTSAITAITILAGWVFYLVTHQH